MQPSAHVTTSALQTINLTGLNHPCPCAPLPTLSPTPRDVEPTARGESGGLLLSLDRTLTEYPLPVSLAHYSSFLVVRSDLPGEDPAEFAGATAAVNDPHSQSGHTSLVMELERRGHRMPSFGRARISGAHSASIRMLAEGAADIAAIDCVSYAHFQRNGDPDVGAIRIIGRTPEAPAPPYITFGSREPDIDAILYESLCEAWRIRKPDPRARYCSSRRRFSRMRRSMQEWKRFVLRGVERAKRELRGSGFLPASAAESGQFQRRNPTRRIILVGGCVVIDCSGSRIPPSVRGVCRRS